MRRSPTPIRNEKDFLRKNRSSLQYHSTVWAVLFCINLMATILMFYNVIEQTIGFSNCINMLFSKYQDARHLVQIYPDEKFYQIVNLVKNSVKFSLIATLSANTFHFLFAIFFPTLYINTNLLANLILFLAPLTFLIHKGYFSFSENNVVNLEQISYCIGSIILAVIGIFLFFYRQRLVKMSAAMMKASSKMLLKHFSLFFVEIIQLLILLIVNGLYIILILIKYYYSTKLNMNVFHYLYAGFSYYWILMTVYYVGYMTTAGVVGYEFYLGNHSSMPMFIVFHAFKRAITYQFGCACYVGLVLSFFQTLKEIIDWLKPDDSKKSENNENTLFLFKIEQSIKKIIYYSLYLIVVIIEKIFKTSSKHALIYCAIFGSSYSNACYRWKRQSFSAKFMKFQHSSMISSALLTNYCISTVLAIVLALTLCFNYIEDFNIISNFSYFTSFLTFALMTSVFYILNSLITTTSDTLYLCFLEQPNILHKEFRSLYDSLEKI